MAHAGVVLLAERREGAPQGGKNIRLRMAEAVDGLLDISNEEAGALSADCLKHGVLKRIDVLVFVHADGVVLLRQRMGNLRPLPVLQEQGIGQAVDGCKIVRGARMARIKKAPLKAGEQPPQHQALLAQPTEKRCPRRLVIVEQGADALGEVLAEGGAGCLDRFQQGRAFLAVLLARLERGKGGFRQRREVRIGADGACKVAREIHVRPQRVKISGGQVRVAAQGVQEGRKPRLVMGAEAAQLVKEEPAPLGIKERTGAVGQVFVRPALQGIHALGEGFQLFGQLVEQLGQSALLPHAYEMIGKAAELLGTNARHKARVPLGDKVGKKGQAEQICLLLVQNTEALGNACLRRKAAQDSDAEGVNGGNACCRQQAQLAGKKFVVGACKNGISQRRANARTQLCRRAPRKGDGENAGEGDSPCRVRQGFNNALGQHRRFTRPCGGGEQHGAVAPFNGKRLLGGPAFFGRFCHRVLSRAGARLLRDFLRLLFASRALRLLFWVGYKTNSVTARTVSGSSSGISPRAKKPFASTRRRRVPAG